MEWRRSELRDDCSWTSRRSAAPWSSRGHRADDCRRQLPAQGRHTQPRVPRATGGATAIALHNSNKGGPFHVAKRSLFCLPFPVSGRPPRPRSGPPPAPDATRGGVGGCVRRGGGVAAAAGSRAVGRWWASRGRGDAAARCGRAANPGSTLKTTRLSGKLSVSFKPPHP